MNQELIKIFSSIEILHARMPILELDLIEATFGVILTNKRFMTSHSKNMVLFAANFFFGKNTGIDGGSYILKLDCNQSITAQLNLHFNGILSADNRIVLHEKLGINCFESDRNDGLFYSRKFPRLSVRIEQGALLSIWLES